MTAPSPLAWSHVSRPLIGMLHLPPLPGSPRFSGSLKALWNGVLCDADALIGGGMHALMLENFGDAPFFPRRVPAATIAHMTVLAGEVRRRFDVPLGINVLRNDGRSALAIAQAVGAAFIRVNVLCGARVTDQGLIEGIAHDLLRERAALRAEDVSILADVDVKHSAPLARRPIPEEAVETVERGGADALIVSGEATGIGADVRELRAAAEAVPTVPVLAGSGVTAGTLEELFPYADGFIVGTWLKQDGQVSQPVSVDRVRELVAEHARLSKAIGARKT